MHLSSNLGEPIHLTNLIGKTGPAGMGSVMCRRGSIRHAKIVGFVKRMRNRRPRGHVAWESDYTGNPANPRSIGIDARREREGRD